MTGNSTVLIVDDEVSNRKTLQFLLAPLGYTLEFAGDGVEALEKAAEVSPDLILLDVMMPRLDGFEVCRKLRADPVLAEIPILMVTALDDRDSLLQGIQAGADDFISKPFDRLELRSRVQTVVRLNRYRRLTAERTRFAWVVAQSEDGYVVTNERDELTYANAAARRHLGLPEDEEAPLAGRFTDLADRHYRWEPETARVARHQPFYLIRPETELEPALWLRVNELALPTGAGSDRVIQLRNVTAQVSMWREMWSFSTSVQHKLRTPLALMAHSLELMGEFAGTASPQEIKQVADIAQRSLERLRVDVEDVFQYVRAHAVEHDGTGFPVADLEALARDLGRQLGLEAMRVTVAEPLALSVASRAKHAEVGLTLKLGRPAREWVLREILENARKFHPLNAPEVCVNAEREGDRLVLQIGDDGVSLSPEQLARMWTPYYQVEKSLTGQVAGMGLGLAMVAVLVMNAGGACKAYNRPEGPGLIVELRLPLTIDAKVPVTDASVGE
ncbi:MAG: response regulator [Anaerolineales bacterium]